MADKDQNKDVYSSDKKKQDYPGYKPYPAEDDIMRKNNGKENLDEQNIAVPNAYDIPGQEHITPAPLGELADTTASSADEEDILHGDSLDERSDDDVKIVMGTDADVTKGDLKMLDEAEQNFDTVDDINLQNARLDDTDEDGDPLNEESIDEDESGDDLDVPGGELDDADEQIGEEDEENNYYSLGGDEHENLDEDNYNS